MFNSGSVNCLWYHLKLVGGIPEERRNLRERTSWYRRLPGCNAERAGTQRQLRYILINCILEVVDEVCAILLLRHSYSKRSSVMNSLSSRAAAFLLRALARSLRALVLTVNHIRGGRMFNGLLP